MKVFNTKTASNPVEIPADTAVFILDDGQTIEIRQQKNDLILRLASQGEILIHPRKSDLIRISVGEV